MNNVLDFTKFKIHVIPDVNAFDFSSLEEGFNYAIKDDKAKIYNEKKDIIEVISIIPYLETGMIEMLSDISNIPFAGMKHQIEVPIMVNKPILFTVREQDYLYLNNVNPFRWFRDRNGFSPWGTKYILDKIVYGFSRYNSYNKIGTI